MAIIHENYADFGPKLAELDDIHVSDETLKKWMKEDGLWTDRAGKKPRVFTPPPTTRKGNANPGSLAG